MATDSTTTRPGPARRDPPGDQRWLVRVSGTVQGVGFRPFVYRQARGRHLVGTVRNDTAGVLVDVQGPPAQLQALCRALAEEPPPLARVRAVSVEAVGPAEAGRAGFRILASDDAAPADVAVSVDVGPCEDCLAELGDPADRRYAYPFVNCTACGPRYTIVRSVPYDRPATTMAGFTMCPACQAEYDDPADRRFHAEPNACPACGPRLVARRPDGTVVAVGAAALAGALRALAGGSIVAIKGVGGYHLAVDATSPAAVAELRRRKARDDKPFALLVADLDAAGALCVLDPAGAAVLGSARRPIVLCARRDGAPVADGVAPGLPELGVMLPPSPLHHLLAVGFAKPLVMTSGNRSEEPIAHDDDDALERLGPIADLLVGHDRAVHIRCDDSVVRAAGGRVQVLRRSRGYAPEPLALPRPAPRPLLAVGAELKSTVAVAHGSQAVLSHHLGDLEHPATHQAFRQAVGHLCGLTGLAPALVVHDLHPQYLSTAYATELDLPALGVQHHHAHVASCLAEHGRQGPVLGVAFDGLGWGDDGTLWGGELLLADLVGYRRVGHLRPVTLPGAVAARQPWRMACAWAAAVFGAEAGAVVADLDADAGRLLGLLGAERPPAAWTATTSVGRLFDAVAALLGVRSVASYEAQAAVELEALARRAVGAVPTWPLTRQGPAPAADGAGGAARGVAAPVVLDPAPILRGVLEARRRGMAGERLAAAFHRSLGSGVAGAAAELAGDLGVSTVVLTGGVFQNHLLTGIVSDALGAAGLEVLVHAAVPPGDGGIAFGQAAIGAARLDAGLGPTEQR